MNTPPEHHAALRWQLRALRRDAPPVRDLWPEIAARIEAAGHRPPVPVTRPVRRWWWPAAMAAALTAVVIGLVWQRPPPGAGEQHALLVGAELIAQQYQSALDELQRQSGIALEDAELSLLDASAARVHAALAQDPDARFLLDQLQQIYARRLSLTWQLLET